MTYPHCDPKPWLELAEFIQTAMHALPVQSVPASWFPEILPIRETAQSFVERREDVYRCYRASYLEHLEGTMRAFAQFFREGQYPELRQPEVFWLKAMMGAVQAFAHSAVLSHDGTPSTILPFPNAEVKEVASWFCIHWWMDRGLKQFAMQVALTPEKDLSEFQHGLN